MDGQIEQNGEIDLPSTEVVTINYIIPFSTRRIFQYNFSSFSGKRIDDSYEYLYSTDKLICAVIYFYGNTTATGKINWFASGK